MNEEEKIADALKECFEMYVILIINLSQKKKRSENIHSYRKTELRTVAIRQ